MQREDGDFRAQTRRHEKGEKPQQHANDASELLLFPSSYFSSRGLHPYLKRSLTDAARKRRNIANIVEQTVVQESEKMWLTPQMMTVTSEQTTSPQQQQQQPTYPFSPTRIGNPSQHNSIFFVSSSAAVSPATTPVNRSFATGGGGGTAVAVASSLLEPLRRALGSVLTHTPTTPRPTASTSPEPSHHHQPDEAATVQMGVGGCRGEQQTLTTGGRGDGSGFSATVSAVTTAATTPTAGVGQSSRKTAIAEAFIARTRLQHQEGQQQKGDFGGEGGGREGENNHHKTEELNDGNRVRTKSLMRARRSDVFLDNDENHHTNNDNETNSQKGEREEESGATTPPSQQREPTEREVFPFAAAAAAIDPSKGILTPMPSQRPCPSSVRSAGRPFVLRSSNTAPTFDASSSSPSSPFELFAEFLIDNPHLVPFVTLDKSTLTSSVSLGSKFIAAATPQDAHNQTTSLRKERRRDDKKEKANHQHQVVRPANSKHKDNKIHLMMNHTPPPPPPSPPSLLSPSSAFDGLPPMLQGCEERCLFETPLWREPALVLPPSTLALLVTLRNPQSIPIKFLKAHGSRAFDWSAVSSFAAVPLSANVGLSEAMVYQCVLGIRCPSSSSAALLPVSKRGGGGNKTKRKNESEHDKGRRPTNNYNNSNATASISKLPLSSSKALLAKNDDGKGPKTKKEKKPANSRHQGNSNQRDEQSEEITSVGSSPSQPRRFGLLSRILTKLSGNKDGKQQQQKRQKQQHSKKEEDNSITSSDGPSSFRRRLLGGVKSSGGSDSIISLVHSSNEGGNSNGDSNKKKVMGKCADSSESDEAGTHDDEDDDRKSQDTNDDDDGNGSSDGSSSRETWFSSSDDDQPIPLHSYKGPIEGKTRSVVWGTLARLRREAELLRREAYRRQAAVAAATAASRKNAAEERGASVLLRPSAFSVPASVIKRFAQQSRKPPPTALVHPPQNVREEEHHQLLPSSTLRLRNGPSSPTTATAAAAVASHHHQHHPFYVSPPQSPLMLSLSRRIGPAGGDAAADAPPPPSFVSSPYFGTTMPPSTTTAVNVHNPTSSQQCKPSSRHNNNNTHHTNTTTTTAAHQQRLLLLSAGFSSNSPSQPPYSPHPPMTLSLPSSGEGGEEGLPSVNSNTDGSKGMTLHIDTSSAPQCYHPSRQEGGRQNSTLTLPETSQSSIVATARGNRNAAGEKNYQHQSTAIVGIYKDGSFDMFGIDEEVDPIRFYLDTVELPRVISPLPHHHDKQANHCQQQSLRLLSCPLGRGRDGDNINSAFMASPFASSSACCPPDNNMMTMNSNHTHRPNTITHHTPIIVAANNADNTCKSPPPPQHKHAMSHDDVRSAMLSSNTRSGGGLVTTAAPQHNTNTFHQPPPQQSQQPSSSAIGRALSRRIKSISDFFAPSAAIQRLEGGGGGGGVGGRGGTAKSYGINRNTFTSSWAAAGAEEAPPLAALTGLDDSSSNSETQHQQHDQQQTRLSPLFHTIAVTSTSSNNYAVVNKANHSSSNDCNPTQQQQQYRQEILAAKVAVGKGDGLFRGIDAKQLRKRQEELMKTIAAIEAKERSAAKELRRQWRKTQVYRLHRKPPPPPRVMVMKYYDTRQVDSPNMLIRFTRHVTSTTAEAFAAHELKFYELLAPLFAENSMYFSPHRLQMEQDEALKEVKRAVRARREEKNKRWRQDKVVRSTLEVDKTRGESTNKEVTREHRFGQKDAPLCVSDDGEADGSAVRPVIVVEDDGFGTLAVGRGGETARDTASKRRRLFRQSSQVFLCGGGCGGEQTIIAPIVGEKKEGGQKGSWHSNDAKNKGVAEEEDLTFKAFLQNDNKDNDNDSYAYCSITQQQLLMSETTTQPAPNNINKGINTNTNSPLMSARLSNCLLSTQPQQLHQQKQHAQQIAAVDASTSACFALGATAANTTQRGQHHPTANRGAFLPPLAPPPPLPAAPVASPRQQFNHDSFTTPPSPLLMAPKPSHQREHANHMDLSSEAMQRHHHDHQARPEEIFGIGGKFHYLSVDQMSESGVFGRDVGTIIGGGQQAPTTNTSAQRCGVAAVGSGGDGTENKISYFEYRNDSSFVPPALRRLIQNGEEEKDVATNSSYVFDVRQKEQSHTIDATNRGNNRTAHVDPFRQNNDHEEENGPEKKNHHVASYRRPSSVSSLSSASSSSSGSDDGRQRKKKTNGGDSGGGSTLRRVLMKMAHVFRRDDKVVAKERGSNHNRLQSMSTKATTIANIPKAVEPVRFASETDMVQLLRPGGHPHLKAMRHQARRYAHDKEKKLKRRRQLAMVLEERDEEKERRASSQKEREATNNVPQVTNSKDKMEEEDGRRGGGDNGDDEVLRYSMCRQATETPIYGDNKGGRLMLMSTSTAPPPPPQTLRLDNDEQDHYDHDDANHKDNDNDKQTLLTFVERSSPTRQPHTQQPSPMQTPSPAKAAAVGAVASSPLSIVQNSPVHDDSQPSRQCRIRRRGTEEKKNPQEAQQHSVARDILSCDDGNGDDANTTRDEEGDDSRRDGEGEDSGETSQIRIGIIYSQNNSGSNRPPSSPPPPPLLGTALQGVKGYGSSANNATIVAANPTAPPPALVRAKTADNILPLSTSSPNVATTIMNVPPPTATAATTSLPSLFARPTSSNNNNDKKQRPPRRYDYYSHIEGNLRCPFRVPTVYFLGAHQKGLPSLLRYVCCAEGSGTVVALGLEDLRASGYSFDHANSESAAAAAHLLVSEAGHPSGRTPVIAKTNNVAVSGTVGGGRDGLAATAAANSGPAAALLSSNPHPTAKSAVVRVKMIISSTDGSRKTAIRSHPILPHPLFSCTMTQQRRVITTTIKKGANNNNNVTSQGGDEREKTTSTGGPTRDRRTLEEEVEEEYSFTFRSPLRSDLPGLQSERLICAVIRGIAYLHSVMWGRASEPVLRSELPNAMIPLLIHRAVNKNVALECGDEEDDEDLVEEADENKRGQKDEEKKKKTSSSKKRAHFHAEVVDYRLSGAEGADANDNGTNQRASASINNNNNNTNPSSSTMATSLLKMGFSKSLRSVRNVRAQFEKWFVYPPTDVLTLVSVQNAVLFIQDRWDTIRAEALTIIKSKETIVHGDAHYKNCGFKVLPAGVKVVGLGPSDLLFEESMEEREGDGVNKRKKKMGRNQRRDRGSGDDEDKEANQKKSPSHHHHKRVSHSHKPPSDYSHKSNDGSADEQQEEESRRSQRQHAKAMGGDENGDDSNSCDSFNFNDDHPFSPSQNRGAAHHCDAPRKFTNPLLQYDDEDEMVQACFLDFQGCGAGSIAAELLYFMCTSCPVEVEEESGIPATLAAYKQFKAMRRSERKRWQQQIAKDILSGGDAAAQHNDLTFEAYLDRCVNYNPHHARQQQQQQQGGTDGGNDTGSRLSQPSLTSYSVYRNYNPPRTTVSRGGENGRQAAQATVANIPPMTNASVASSSSRSRQTHQHQSRRGEGDGQRVVVQSQPLPSSILFSPIPRQWQVIVFRAPMPRACFSVYVRTAPALIEAANQRTTASRGDVAAAGGGNVGKPIPLKIAISTAGSLVGSFAANYTHYQHEAQIQARHNADVARDHEGEANICKNNEESSCHRGRDSEEEEGLNALAMITSLAAHEEQQRGMQKGLLLPRSHDASHEDDHSETPPPASHAVQRLVSACSTLLPPQYTTSTVAIPSLPTGEVIGGGGEKDAMAMSMMMMGGEGNGGDAVSNASITLSIAQQRQSLLGVGDGGHQFASTDNCSHNNSFANNTTTNHTHQKSNVFSSNRSGRSSYLLPPSAAAATAAQEEAAAVASLSASPSSPLARTSSNNGNKNALAMLKREGGEDHPHHHHHKKHGHKPHPLVLTPTIEMLKTPQRGCEEAHNNRGGGEERGKSGGEDEGGAANGRDMANVNTTSSTATPAVPHRTHHHQTNDTTTTNDSPINNRDECNDHDNLHHHHHTPRRRLTLEELYVYDNMIIDYYYHRLMQGPKRGYVPSSASVFADNPFVSPSSSSAAAAAGGGAGDYNPQRNSAVESASDTDDESDDDCARNDSSQQRGARAGKEKEENKRCKKRHTTNGSQTTGLTSAACGEGFERARVPMTRARLAREVYMLARHWAGCLMFDLTSSSPAARHRMKKVKAFRDMLEWSERTSRRLFLMVASCYCAVDAPMETFDNNCEAIQACAVAVEKERLALAKEMEKMHHQHQQAQEQHQSRTKNNPSSGAPSGLGSAAAVLRRSVSHNTNSRHSSMFPPPAPPTSTPTAAATCVTPPSATTPKNNNVHNGNDSSFNPSSALL